MTSLDHLCLCSLMETLVSYLDLQETFFGLLEPTNLEDTSSSIVCTLSLSNYCHNYHLYVLRLFLPIYFYNVHTFPKCILRGDVEIGFYMVIYMILHLFFTSLS